MQLYKRGWEPDFRRVQDQNSNWPVLISEGGSLDNVERIRLYCWQQQTLQESLLW